MLLRPAVSEARPKEALPPLDSQPDRVSPPSATPPEGLRDAAPGAARRRAPEPRAYTRAPAGVRARASGAAQVVGLG